MLVKRNIVRQWLECVHPIWNARKVILFDMGRGRVGVSVMWTDDGPDKGRRRYPNFRDRFIFDLYAMSKWDFQTALWHRLENRRTQVA